ncbi:MAG: hypothetical protein PHU75_02980 [Candidatus Nanopelagicales bacterium]|nr:hypothetical protein [Candidatus Nanopelagicales bacterium]
MRDDAVAGSLHELEVRRNFSTATLGFMCLVPVIVVIAAQAFSLGHLTMLGSSVPVADAGLWSSCASALANGHESVNLAWCLRRPLTMFVQTPFFMAAPTSLPALVVLQCLAVCMTFWWFLVTIARRLPMNRAGLLLIYALGLWPVLAYGTYLGPEAVALGLSLGSAATLLTYLSTSRLRWGIACGGLAILAFQIRPGNVFLTAALCGGIAVWEWRRDRRWWAAIGVGALFVAIGFLPTRVMQVAGWSQAGHASNFWSAAYSAATPESDSWEAAYDQLAAEVDCPLVADWSADPCLAFETDAFGDLLRDRAIALMRAHPEAMAYQLVTNLKLLGEDGYLNQMWATPATPAWQIWRAHDRAFLMDGWNGVYAAFATLVWAASWVVLALLCFATFRLRRQRGSPAGDVALVSKPMRTAMVTVVVALVAIVGAATTFALVGHTEPQRHLVQNVPYILAAIGALTFIPWRKRDQFPAIPLRRRSPRWAWVLLGALIGALAMGSLMEGHRTSTQLRVSSSCESSDSSLTPYAVVGSVSVASKLAAPDPMNWRRLSDRSVSVLFDNYWVRTMLDKLPSGHILDLRSGDTGEIVPVFISDADLSTASTGSWCVRSPDQHGVMVVHDLVPMTTS